VKCGHSAVAEDMEALRLTHSGDSLSAVAC